MNKNTIHINPNFVADLIAPVVFARDLDMDREMLEALNFENPEHMKLFVTELIAPEFQKLDELSQLATKESLRFAIQGDAEKNAPIYNQCELVYMNKNLVPQFLDILWRTVYPDENVNESKHLNYSYSTKPLKYNQKRNISIIGRTFEERLNDLYRRL